jgi:hypothetical protein
MLGLKAFAGLQQRQAAGVEEEQSFGKSLASVVHW